LSIASSSTESPREAVKHAERGLFGSHADWHKFVGLGFDDGHHRQHAVASLLEADHAIVDHRVAALSNGADDTGRTDDTGVTAAERLSLCSSLSDRPKSHLFSRRAGARILAS
jgi:hypothetical protein